MELSSTAVNGHQANNLFVKRREWNSELVRAKTEAEVIALWQAHGSQFSCVNVSTALISFTKSAITSDGERCICNMLHYYVENAGFIRVRDAASTVDSLAKLHFRGEEIECIRERLFSVIAQNAAHNNFFEKPIPISFVQLLQNFADEGQKGDDLFQAVVPQATRYLGNFTTKQMVQIASSCSKKGYKSEPLFEEIEKQVLKNIYKYSASDLSCIAFAFTSLQLGTEAFFKATYSKIKRALKELDPVGIESCLYAFGQSDEKWALSKALEAVIISKKSIFSPQDFVSVLAVCSKMQIGDDNFLQAMEHGVLDRLEQFTPDSLALIASSFANVLGGSYSFFSKLEQRVIECIEQFSTQDLVLLYHAYSISRLADGKFLAQIERELELEDNLELQEVVIMIWSMLLARSVEVKYLEVLLDLLNQACETEMITTINPQKLIEIETMIKTDVPELVCKMNKPLLDAIERAKQESVVSSQERSSLQISVEEALERCGYQFASKQILDGVPVDILIASEKLVIEVCDKSHYYRTNPNELVATSLMKKRILESRGYRLIHLPSFEWSWGKKQQELYLRELFARKYTPIAEIK